MKKTIKAQNSVVHYKPPDEWSRYWHDPNVFYDQVSLIKKPITACEFFSNPQLKFLRETWAASCFSKILILHESCKIKMADEADRFPDFRLLINNKEQDFELVEADKEGRRRGDEYKADALKRAQGIAITPKFYDPDEEEKAAFDAIERVVKLKATKNYSQKINLLVYVNFSLTADEDMVSPEIEKTITMLENYVDSFESIWLLWQEKAIRCFPVKMIICGR